MTLRLLPVLVLMALAGPCAAQSDPASSARAAADQLEAASVALSKAKTARDRVKALTGTVQGYEAGLAAMREGLRRVAIRERQLSRDLAGREEEIASLLGALQSIGKTEGPAILLHPAGPTGTARSGMILAEVAPALQQRANALKSELEEVTTLRSLQEEAAGRLQTGLTGVQEARTALSKALADRTDLPKRFTEDPIQTAVLIASTETLEGFASGLTEIVEGEGPPPANDIEDLKGLLALPVDGRLLRFAGEPDAAGVVRPGVVVATRPQALVTSPTAATIRYRGPLLDYGQVVILEPRAGLMFVFAGMDVVYGEAGQVLPGGSPVGLMGGADAKAGSILSQSSDGSGSDRSETLYIEVRQDTDAVDPLTWFTSDKE